MSNSSRYIKFTGMVEQMGKVTDIQKNTYVTIEPLGKVYKNMTLEEPIAVDGRQAIVTMVGENAKHFQVQIKYDSNAVPLKLGDNVNLERCLTDCSRIAGIFELGVLDGSGKVTKIVKHDDGRATLTIYSKSDRVITNAAVNAMVLVNGVAIKVKSLDVKSRKFEFVLYHHTKDITNLGLLKENDCVNIEVDVLSKYVLGGYTVEPHARMAQEKGPNNWEHDILGKHVARYYHGLHP